MDKKKYYKFVRVLCNGHRVSSFITTKSEDPDGFNGLNQIVDTPLKRLNYSTKKVTKAPSNSNGVYIVDIPEIVSCNVAGYNVLTGHDRLVKVELWEVRTFGAVTRVIGCGNYFNCSSVILTKLLETKWV